MKIKTKTRDILSDFPSYLKNGGQYYSCIQDIRALTISVRTIDENNEHLLYAEIGWDFSTRTRVGKEFPYTEHGFSDMCEWLDEKRLCFVEELL